MPRQNKSKYTDTIRVIREWLFEGKHIEELLRELDKSVDKLSLEELLLRGVIANSAPIVRIGTLMIYRCEEEYKCEESIAPGICVKFVKGVNPKKVKEVKDEIERLGCTVLLTAPVVKDVKGDEIEKLFGEEQ